MYPKNLSNKDEAPNNEEKGQKHMFLTTRPIWKLIRPHWQHQIMAHRKNSSWKESVSQPQIGIKSAKVVIASRVNQSLLNTFSETIIVDLKKIDNKNNNIVSCIKVNAIS